MLTPEDLALLDRLLALLGDPTPTTIDAQIARLLKTEFVTPYSSGVQYDDIAAIGPTLTTAVSITPTYPVGATKVRAIAVVDLFIMNDSVNGQKVTPILQVQLAAGGFNNVWTPGAAIVSVPATDGTSASIRAVVDISAYVATVTATTIKWSVTQTSANSVHYTSQATIFLVYTV